ncbi:MAG: hypothetical protein GXY52_08300 [Chloroflexi bacterium]|nr:hypothetical protein [Chloroflexota bacterium]
MATSMTKRERVLRTLAFEETDRTPTYDILENDSLIERVTGERLTTANGNRVKARAIALCLDMTRMPHGPNEPGKVHTADGLTYRVERWTSWVTARPWNTQAELIEWVKGRIRSENARTFGPAEYDQFCQNLDYFQGLFGDDTVQIVESGVGLTEMYSPMGWEAFSYLIMDEPDLVEEWLEARNQAELRRVACIGDAQRIPVVLTYDDIAYKTSTHTSPDWLRRVWVPRLARLNAAWHERGAKCIFHSDGNLWAVMDDLVAAGIDGINPIEVQAGMTVPELRARYPQLVLTSGIDVSALLPFGTPDEVRQAVTENIRATHGRGYLVGSSTELHNNVSAENALAMYETAWQHSGV